MPFFGTPKGLLVAGVVVVLAGVFDLFTGSQSRVLAIVLIVAGTALALLGLLRWRVLKAAAKSGYDEVR